MNVVRSGNPAQWDAFLGAQRFRPFLQSWTMGDVYADVGQEPVRLQIERNGEIIGICFGHVVNARRGKHLAVPYGPVLATDAGDDALQQLIAALREEAAQRGCTFIRMSPFRPLSAGLPVPGARPAPLHLLAEHIWYIPLKESDPWGDAAESGRQKTEEELLMSMRKTTRNLVRRAERDGVTVTASGDPVSDLQHFLFLHEETRKRHGFTPYTNAFFRAQVERFSARGECTLYLARYQTEVIATSVHMHLFGETSYHHGASTAAFAKVPASPLLQWTAICDALRRGDDIYSFWGIAPTHVDAEGSRTILNAKHPFAGVTLFKTGFGGQLLDLTHCIDLPLSVKYYGTRAFETVRKWKRGF